MSNSAATKGVPKLDLCSEVEGLWDALHVAIDRVLRSSQFILGPEVEGFEQEAARFLGTCHAVVVSSGTDALVIALRVLGVGEGGEVITTPFSFFATAESISAVGADQMFVDIEEDTFNLDPERLAEQIGRRPKAIIPVHLCGQPSRIEEITAVALDNGVSVLEDCAQSFRADVMGRMTSTFGDAAAFSFFPSNNLGAYGDGGMIATNRDDVAAPARMLRAHGGRKKYHNQVVSYGSRLDSLRSAILRVKLPNVQRWIERHVFQQYAVRIIRADRNCEQVALKQRGVDSMDYYHVPQDRLPVYAGYHPTSKVSDLVVGRVLNLPIGPYLSTQAQEQAASALREALA